MWAAYTRSYKTVDLLLQAGADYNLTSSDGHTALTMALHSKDSAMIDKLCSITTEGRKMAFVTIAQCKVNITEPLRRFVTESLSIRGNILF